MLALGSVNKAKLLQQFVSNSVGLRRLRACLVLAVLVVKHVLASEQIKVCNAKALLMARSVTVRSEVNNDNDVTC